MSKMTEAKEDLVDAQESASKEKRETKKDKKAEKEKISPEMQQRIAKLSAYTSGDQNALDQ